MVDLNTTRMKQAMAALPSASRRHSEGAAPIQALELLEICEQIRHHNRCIESLIGQLESHARANGDQARSSRRTGR